MITDIYSEDRLVQRTFAEHLEKVLGWDSVYAYNTETFGPESTLGRSSEREAVLLRDLQWALEYLNKDVPESARKEALEKLTATDFARSLVQHNREFYGFLRDGVPVQWQEAGETRHAHVKVIDFRHPRENRFLAVRELKIQGTRVPHYNRRADLVCFVNGLPLGSMSTVFAARPDSRACPRCAMPWTLSIRQTNPSAVSRSSRGKFSAAPRHSA
jgi:type I restriction enzyme R subunit